MSSTTTTTTVTATTTTQYASSSSSAGVGAGYDDGGGVVCYYYGDDNALPPAAAATTTGTTSSSQPRHQRTASSSSSSSSGTVVTGTGSGSGTGTGSSGAMGLGMGLGGSTGNGGAWAWGATVGASSMMGGAGGGGGVGVVACVDRTGDFSQAVRAAAAAAARSAAAPKRVVIVEESGPTAKSRFAIIAAQMGRDIHITSQKLCQLTEAAKSKSLFDESTLAPQISRLTAEVNEDVMRLSQELDLLKKEAELNRQKRNMEPKTSPQPLSKYTAQEHSDKIVAFFQLALQKATNEFKEVLNARTKNIQQQQERKHKLLGSTPTFENRADSLLYRTSDTTTPTTGDSVAITIQPEVSRAPKRPIPSSLSRGSTAPEDIENLATGSTTATPTSVDVEGGGLAVQAMVRHRDTYLESRTQAVRQIETTLVQLQSMFHQVAQLVAEQDEYVKRIDERVDEASHNVDVAHREIVKAEKRVSSNKWLAVKVFSVLVLFIILFIVFFL
ncbi:Integral membrane protein [Pelomyxa schiedti]|nr:Integral membrane protein [Pelomyxa schiedti]